MKPNFLPVILILVALSTGCASRKVIQENDLPKPIMDSRVELNAELFGESHNPSSKVSLYVQATPARMQAGSIGGLMFNYLFDPEMQIKVDGKSYVLRSKDERRVNSMSFKEVPQSLVKTLANASRVEIALSADQGRITYNSDFSPKNRRKFQEFVHEYIDEKQEVERPSFLMRLLFPDDQ